MGTEWGVIQTHAVRLCTENGALQMNEHRTRDQWWDDRWIIMTGAPCEGGRVLRVLCGCVTGGTVLRVGDCLSRRGGGGRLLSKVACSRERERGWGHKRGSYMWQDLAGSCGVSHGQWSKQGCSESQHMWREQMAPNALSLSGYYYICPLFNGLEKTNTQVNLEQSAWMSSFCPA